MPHDFEINTQLNAVLVAHYIDTSQVNISSISGSVYIVGTMVLRGKGWASVSGNLMERIESQFKAIKGVEWISYYLENMVHIGDKWQHLQPKKKKAVTRKLTAPSENINIKAQLAAIENYSPESEDYWPTADSGDYWPATESRDYSPIATKTLHEPTSVARTKPVTVAGCSTAATNIDSATAANKANPTPDKFKKSIEQRASTRRAFPALVPKSKNIFSPTEFMRTFTQNVQQHDPTITLSRYFGKCYQQLRQESLQHQVNNEQMLVVLDLLQKHTQRFSLKLETWDTIFSQASSEGSPQDLCAGIHIFFRFLALLLLHLKHAMGREQRVQVAIEVVQHLGDKNFCCMPEKKCSLQSIFQYCRKNDPFESLFCKFGQE